MVLHAAHNMLSVYFAVKLKEHVPGPAIIAAGVALGICGIVAVVLATRAPAAEGQADAS
jgi:hypothetical protein